LTKSEIGILRTEIERVDAEILDLVTRRQRVASEIGLVKEKDGIPIRDRPREKQVISNFVKTARTRGVDSVFAEILAELLISDAVKVQKTKKDKDLIGKTAVVVGGSGRMGAWCCRRLSNRGANVKVWDPRGKLDGYPNLKSLGRDAKEAALVVVASPLGACPDDLKAVIDIRPNGLVFDICSVKSHIASQLRSAAKEGIKVASAHPMFGPNVANPKGQNVLLCDCGSEKGFRLVKELFMGSDANIVQVGLDRHDELMAYVLGLSHLCSLVFAGTLARSGNELTELRSVQGPSFSKLTRMAVELSKESTRVYHDIQALNPTTRRMFAEVEEVLREVRKASLDTNPVKFKRIIDTNRNYLEVG